MNCIIIYGRQSKLAFDNINYIISILKADLFLVYDNDICNYSNHINLKDKKKVNDESSLSAVENQYNKIKLGWILMEEYEKKNRFKYKVVYRFRGYILYNIDLNINFSPEKNNSC